MRECRTKETATLIGRMKKKIGTTMNVAINGA